MSNEMVPLADRLRYMQVYRLVIAALVLGLRFAIPDLVRIDVLDLLAATGAFAVASLAGEALWRLGKGPGLRIFGGMLLVDGLYIAWITYLSGGTASPLRYTILLHVVAVTLLASYRTGLKLAMWHSLLVIATFHAEEANILARIDVGVTVPATPYEQMSAFICVLWILAIATAAFSAVNERELRRRKYDLQALAGMADQLEQEMRPLAVAKVLLDSVVDAFDFERGVILGSPHGDLDMMAGHNLDISTNGAVPADAIIERAWATRRTVLFRHLNPVGDPVLSALLPGAENVMVTPLLAEGRSVGALVVERQPNTKPRVEKRVVTMVEQFAAHASLALRNAWLLEEVQKMASTDGLTRIANRRTFEETLERELHRAERNVTPLSLVMLDIDHFKSLNDTYGHQTGDEVLRRVAAVLASNCRDFDTPARYGGEEFGIILPDCPGVDAQKFADRIRLAVAAADTAVPVTISLGVASFPRNAADPAALVSAADAALYESKRGGRNRVSVSTREDESRLRNAALH